MTGTGPRPVTVVLVHGPAGRADELAATGLRVLAAASGAEAAVEETVAARPDVVVVDLGSDAGADAGLTAIALVADGLPGVAVLAVSASDEHADILAAVRAGATGYLVTDAGLGAERAVADAVLRLARGEVVFSPGLAAVVLEAQGGRADPAAPRLSDREIDVLRLVVEGLTAKQIATRLVLSRRTVENRVQIMLRKLGLANRAALVRYAIEHGLA